MNVLEFNGSPNPTIGVEIELQILDPETLDLTPQSEILLEKGIDRVKAEIHQSMLEIDSEICDTVSQCRNFLTLRLQKLNKAAQDSNLQLTILGTHPFQRWSKRIISNNTRYQDLHRKYQWLVRRINVYGLHVHIGVKNGDEALAISNVASYFLPHLLALSANSPFWQGLDTGMQSSRINIMQSFPFAGIPPQFNSWSEFEYYCDILSKAGAISSLKDLYWYIRPNLQFGTIEFRICDAMSSLDETMAIVALIQCLVVNISENPEQWKISREQHWIAPANLWCAERDGLDAIITTDLMEKQKISEGILELIDLLVPTAKNLNCLDELLYVNQMIKNGNGAQRQLKVFKESESLRDVVKSSIEKFSEFLSPENEACCKAYDKNFG